jgi:hypothetical protein
MKNTFLLLAFISIFLSNNKVFAQCAVAEKYVADIQKFQDNATPTEYASSGKKISAWTQFATWYTYKCQCDSPENLSDSEIPQLVNAMNATRGIISKEYSTYGTVPRVYKVSDCKKGNSNSTNSASSKTSTQIEMEKRFQNYNNAMNLKRQGENIAKAYAQQVKSYGELNKANSPEALLQNFNNNMQAIADLQTQNKADNLNQLTNTLSSTINDLNSGNHEGAMFSALSLLDQGEAKREARRDAENVKWLLNYEKQQQMSQFYIKALELNDHAIKQYNEKAAYAYSKEEETYLLEYVSNLECHKVAMQNNFSYSNASWTQNRCAIPEKKTYTVNNLIAKDIQYINAAKRKYALYEKTGEPIFQQGAMRFAGLAATENPKVDYYYLMGHFAGINNPLVAYSSFQTVKSKNIKFFVGEKNTEYSLIKLSLESFFKTAIEDNNQEFIKNIVGAGLHQSVEIDESSPILYAMKIDQADVVFAFLNTELEGKPQSVIKTKVQSALFMSAILDAPNTIQKFVDLGFSIDFSIDGKTPLDVAEESLAIKSFDKISELLGGQSKYNFENSDIVNISALVKSANLNNTIKVTQLYDRLSDVKSKNKALLILLNTEIRSGFFAVSESNEEDISKWAVGNRRELLTACFRDLINRNILDVYKYFTPRLLSFDKTTLEGDEKRLFNDIWTEYSIEESYIYNFEDDKRDYSVIRNSELTKYILGLKSTIDLIKRNPAWREIKNKDELIVALENKKLLLNYLNEKKYYKTENKYVNGKRVEFFDFKGYPIDILEFAVINRRDPKLTKQILINTTYNGRFSNKFFILLARFSDEAFPENTAYPYVAGITELEIAKVLFSHFKVNEESMDKLLKYGCIEYRYKEHLYRGHKDFFDSLIKQGYKLPHQSSSASFLIKEYKNFRNSEDFYWIKQDKKYWKAIYNGNYDSRY